jgi:transcription antitermination factor NusG
MSESPTERKWYVLRDLKRPNAKERAYELLPRLTEGRIELYTPMDKKPVKRNGDIVYKEKPFLPDLLFVHETKRELDALIATIPTLQYRFGKGNSHRSPMTVREEEMEQFMRVVNGKESFIYYTPEEVPTSLYGRHIRIVGGPLDGLEGRLLSKRGSKKRKLIVDLENLLCAAVEVEPQYIQVVE